MGDSTSKCALCDGDLGASTYRPMAQWNISGLICSQCYDKKPVRRDVTKR